MCGIVGVLFYPQQRPDEDWQAIRQAFTQALVHNACRGYSASGIAAVQRDGRADILKKPLPAADFVALPEYQTLLSQIGPETTVILGHTRFPTKGTPANDLNNHPLKAGPVVGVHNGRVLNDDDLFARYECARAGKVDSEIIFRLLEMNTPGESMRDYVVSLGSKLSELEGELTFLAVDSRAPMRLLVLKHDNPLNVYYHEGWRALIFSSCYHPLRRDFGPEVSRENLGHDALLVFDALRLPWARHEPVVSCPICFCSP